MVGLLKIPAPIWRLTIRHMPCQYVTVLKSSMRCSPSSFTTVIIPARESESRGSRLAAPNAFVSIFCSNEVLGLEGRTGSICASMGGDMLRSGLYAVLCPVGKTWHLQKEAVRT